LASSAGDSTNGTAGVLVNRTEKAQTLSATFVEVPEQKEHAQALKLIYFTSPDAPSANAWRDSCRK